MDGLRLVTLCFGPGYGLALVADYIIRKLQYLSNSNLKTCQDEGGGEAKDERLTVTSVV